MTVRADTRRIRPYVVCAVLRNVTFTPSRYASFIDLQDKLHNNICRKRTLVAIGTHDLDTLQPPFTYEALPPTDITFVPLSQSRAFRADALVDFYRTDPSVKHIKPYVDIIAASPVYPVILDSARTVLSLPPLINGEHSKLTVATRNVFIECTATDLTKAHVVLNTVATMFSEYCATPFEVEAVEVVYEEPVAPGTGGDKTRLVASQVTPDLSPRVATVSVAEAASVIGIALEEAAAATLCTRMGLSASVIGPSSAEVPDAVITATERGDGKALLRVSVPPTRADVLHECDIIEDLAIAFGYNNVVRTLPRTQTTGEQLPINRLTDHLRRELAEAGYDETLTLALCSRKENFDDLLLKDDGKTAVILANPQR
jgi:phenylalanyl-tRNA synthetase beta chain